MSATTQDLLTPAATARMIGRTTGWLAKSRLSGEGPTYLKIGARVFYKPLDVEAFLDGCRRRSTSDTAHAA